MFFGAFLAPWGMPFFFLLSGAATWFALHWRAARQFTGERFGRLIAPFAFLTFLPAWHTILSSSSP
jgi:fucose 4-O-acetylase-like acetyltransferase